MKTKVYIAVSISNNPNYKEQFKNAEETLVANGCAVMSPATLPDGFTQEDYMTVCISMINVCDIAVFLNGWERVGLAYTKDPNNFDYNVGRYWALKEAFSQRADRTEN